MTDKECLDAIQIVINQKLSAAIRIAKIHFFLGERNDATYYKTSTLSTQSGSDAPQGERRSG